MPKHISVLPALSHALDRRSLKYFGLYFSEPGPYLRADLGPKIIKRILNCAAISKNFQNIYDVTLTWHWPATDPRLTWDWPETDLILTWDLPEADLRLTWDYWPETTRDWPETDLRLHYERKMKIQCFRQTCAGRTDVHTEWHPELLTEPKICTELWCQWRGRVR